MARLGQHLDEAARQPQFALHGLVAVGDRAQHHGGGHMAGARQFGAQQFRQVLLGNEAGLEIQSGRPAQVAVRGPGIAINAAVLAAPVGIEPHVEGQIGRLVAAQRRARLLPAQFGAQRRGLFILGARFKAAPAIVEGLARVGGEAVRQLAGGTSPLDGMQGNGGWLRRGFRVGAHDWIAPATMNTV
jgi:hypothetical protein